MLETKPRATAAGAAAAMMWAWPLAAARVADAWVARGWTLWSFGPRLSPASGACAEQDRTPADPAGPAAAEPGFASYRSPGGHAAAQVLRPD